MRHSFGVAVRDVDCAFKLVRAATRCARSPLASDGAMISTELLVRAPARRAGGSPRSACTTGRASRASPSGGDPRVIAARLPRAPGAAPRLRDADRAPMPASGRRRRAPAT